jgi:hypothetical protein
METIRDRLPTVSPPRQLVDQLKHEVYTVGTSLTRAAEESALSVATIKSLLQGNNVEQATVARLDAYIKALARNEFYQGRSRKHKEKGILSRHDRWFYAYKMELWKVYQVNAYRLEQFQALDRRKKLIHLNHEDYICKQRLMQKFKPDIERHRIWMPDSWSYFRCKRFLADKLKAIGVKA